MTFDEIIAGKIERLSSKKERELRSQLFTKVSEYCDATYDDPFITDVTREIDALMLKLLPGIKDSADREITQKLLKVFD